MTLGKALFFPEIQVQVYPPCDHCKAILRNSAVAGVYWPRGDHQGLPLHKNSEMHEIPGHSFCTAIEGTRLKKLKDPEVVF